MIGVVFMLLAIGLIIVIGYFHRINNDSRGYRHSQNIGNTSQSYLPYNYAFQRVHLTDTHNSCYCFEAIEKQFVAFDLETTGLRVFDSEILEIAAVRYRNLIPAEEFHVMIRPTRPIPDEATRINGITYKDVRDGLPEDKAVELFERFLEKDDILVAFNARFDTAFLHQMQKSNLDIIPIPIVDVLQLARTYIIAPSYKLSYLSDACDLPHKSTHRGLSDSYACASLLLHIMQTERFRTDRNALMEFERTRIEGKKQEFNDKLSQIEIKRQLFAAKTDKEKEAISIIREILQESGANLHDIKYTSNETYLNFYYPGKTQLSHIDNKSKALYFITTNPFLKIKLGKQLQYVVIKCDNNWYNENKDKFVFAKTTTSDLTYFPKGTYVSGKGYLPYEYTRFMLESPQALRHCASYICENYLNSVKNFENTLTNENYSHVFYSDYPPETIAPDCIDVGNRITDI